MGQFQLEQMLRALKLRPGQAQDRIQCLEITACLCLGQTDDAGVVLKEGRQELAKKIVSLIKDSKQVQAATRM